MGILGFRKTRASKRKEKAEKAEKAEKLETPGKVGNIGSNSKWQGAVGNVGSSSKKEEMNFSVELWRSSFRRDSVCRDLKLEELEVDDPEVETLKKERQILVQKIHSLETRLTYKEAQALTFQEKSSGLQEKLDEKAKELAEVTEDRNRKEKCVEDLKVAVSKLEEEKSVWSKKEEAFVSEQVELASALEDKCTALNRTQAALECEADQLQRKLGEAKGALDSKEAELASMRKEVLILRENNSGLKSAFQSLEEKVVKLLQVELQRQRLERTLAAAELKLAASSESARMLTLQVEQAETELREAKEKIQELESRLEKLAEEKREELAASEWTVQHLGLHLVPKAKADLAQVEQKYQQLKQDFIELEGEMKLKEVQLVDVAEKLIKRVRVLETEKATLSATVEDGEARYQKLKLEHDDAKEKYLCDIRKLENVVVDLQKSQERQQDLKRKMMDFHDLLESKTLVGEKPEHLLIRDSQEAEETLCGKRQRTYCITSNPEEQNYKRHRVGDNHPADT